jgi:DNA-binding NarL/FixJ family response regulator
LIFQADAAFVGVSACLKHPVTAVELVETLAQVIRGVNLVLPYALQLALEVEPLTRRELDVLVEMNKGMSDDEIAKRLNMCKYTVRTHAQHILQKLGVHTRRDAVHRARHRGLVPTPRQ